MFHVELRQFPHTACAFNLDERGLEAILAPWVREQVIELGGRKWSPHLASVTILEGPELPLGQLSMGRGWRNAQRESDEVTERVLATARELGRDPQHTPGAQQPGPDAPQPSAVGGDGSPAERIAGLLGEDPLRLLEAWQAAAARSPELAPSETLALAEHALRAGSPPT